MDPKHYDRGVIEIDGAPEVTVPPCPVCDSRTARARFAIERGAASIVVCDSCGLGRTHPQPQGDEIASYYSGEYYGTPGQKFEGLVEAFVRLVGSRHVRFLAHGLPAGARVLDVGCGRGVLLAELASQGLEVHGVEVSADAVRGADPRAQIRIAGHLRDAAYPAAFFDQVIIWHVLEHLTDPLGTLREARRVLKPSGRLVVAVPNFASRQARWAGAAWFHLDVPRHLYQFPLPALVRLLDRTGFECRRVHHFSLRQNPFGWLQSALNRWTHLPRNSLYVLLHQRPPNAPPPYDSRTRLVLRLCYIAGAPLGMLATAIDTLTRSGATVHVVARARPDNPAAANHSSP